MIVPVRSVAPLGPSETQGVNMSEPDTDAKADAKAARRILGFVGAIMAFAVALAITAGVIAHLSGGSGSPGKLTQAQIQQRNAQAGKGGIAGKS